jgi:hypothetical protein
VGLDTTSKFICWLFYRSCNPLLINIAKNEVVYVAELKLGIKTLVAPKLDHVAANSFIIIDKPIVQCRVGISWEAERADRHQTREHIQRTSSNAGSRSLEIRCLVGVFLSGILPEPILPNHIHHCPISYW